LGGYVSGSKSPHRVAPPPPPKTPQWWCCHSEDGSLREQPLDPNLATEDCLAKVAMCMEWISRNAPGWCHWKKNPEAMVRGPSATHMAGVGNVSARPPPAARRPPPAARRPPPAARRPPPAARRPPPAQAAPSQRPASAHPAARSDAP
jgi:hypothetical protein